MSSLPTLSSSSATGGEPAHRSPATWPSVRTPRRRCTGCSVTPTPATDGSRSPKPCSRHRSGSISTCTSGRSRSTPSSPSTSTSHTSPTSCSATHPSPPPPLPTRSGTPGCRGTPQPGPKRACSPPNPTPASGCGVPRKRRTATKSSPPSSSAPRRSTSGDPSASTRTPGDSPPLGATTKPGEPSRSPPWRSHRDVATSSTPRPPAWDPAARDDVRERRRIARSLASANASGTPERRTGIRSRMLAAKLNSLRSHHVGTHRDHGGPGARPPAAVPARRRRTDCRVKRPRFPTTSVPPVAPGR